MKSQTAKSELLSDPLNRNFRFGLENDCYSTLISPARDVEVIFHLERPESVCDPYSMAIGSAGP